MINTRNLKISIIADIQSKLNKEMKKWCEVDSKFIEKRSVPHGDSKIFTDQNDTQLTINVKTSVPLDIFKDYQDEQILAKQSLIVKDTVDYCMDYVQSYYVNYASSQEVVSNIYQGIKFVFHGLIYVDENTVRLDFSLADTNDPVAIIEYIKGDMT